MKLKLFGLLALLFIIFVWFIGFNTLQESIGGFSTMSLDKVDLFSNGEFFSGEQWVMTFSGRGLGQKALIRETPSTITSKYQGVDVPQHDLIMDMEYDQKCVYPIRKDSAKTPIYEYKLIDKTCLPPLFDAQDAKEMCDEINQEYFASWSKGLSTCYAICQNSLAKDIGYFDDANVDSTITITATPTNNVDAVETATFSTLSDSPKTKIGDKIGVVFQGNLDTGMACGALRPTATPIFDGYNWVAVDSTSYNNYKDFHNTWKFSVLATTGKSPSPNSVNQLIQQINQYSRHAFSRKDVGTIMNSVSQTGATLEKTLTQPVQYPTLTAYIKADWIGIYTPVAEFEVSSANSECFETGTQGYVTATLKNTGQSDGSFDAWVECPTVTSQRIEGSLKPGQSKKISLLLNAPTLTEDKLKEECVLKVENADFQVITTKFNSCVERPERLCKPNVKTCTSRGVEQCASDGWSWTLIEQCPTTCKFTSDGTPYCGDVPPPSGLWNKLLAWLKSTFGFKFPKIALLGLLIGIVGFVFLTTIFQNTQYWKKSKPSMILGALIIAVLVAVIFYFIWWMALIALGIFILVKMFLRFMK